MTAQTSELGGFARGVADEMDASGYPVSSGATRYGIVNNLLHLLDQEGQFLVCAVTSAATDLQLAAPTAIMQQIPGAAFRTLVRLRSGDASSFRVVVYMRARVTAAATGAFRIALRPMEGLTTRPLDPAVVTTTAIVDVTTTSTTGADLTATVYLDAETVRRLPILAYPSEDGGGAPSLGQVHMCELQVWATSTVGSALPTIMALTAREFAGDR